MQTSQFHQFQQFNSLNARGELPELERKRFAILKAELWQYLSTHNVVLPSFDPIPDTPNALIRYCNPWYKEPTKKFMEQIHFRGSNQDQLKDRLVGKSKNHALSTSNQKHRNAMIKNLIQNQKIHLNAPKGKDVNIKNGTGWDRKDKANMVILAHYFVVDYADLLSDAPSKPTSHVKKENFDTDYETLFMNLLRTIQFCANSTNGCNCVCHQQTSILLQNFAPGIQQPLPPIVDNRGGYQSDQRMDITEEVKPELILEQPFQMEEDFFAIKSPSIPGDESLAGGLSMYFDAQSPKPYPTSQSFDSNGMDDSISMFLRDSPRDQLQQFGFSNPNGSSSGGGSNSNSGRSPYQTMQHSNFLHNASPRFSFDRQHSGDGGMMVNVLMRGESKEATRGGNHDDDYDHEFAQTSVEYDSDGEEITDLPPLEMVYSSDDQQHSSDVANPTSSESYGGSRSETPMKQPTKNDSETSGLKYSEGKEESAAVTSSAVLAKPEADNLPFLYGVSQRPDATSLTSGDYGVIRFKDIKATPAAPSPVVTSIRGSSPITVAAVSTPPYTTDRELFAKLQQQKQLQQVIVDTGNPLAVDLPVEIPSKNSIEDIVLNIDVRSKEGKLRLHKFIERNEVKKVDSQLSLQDVIELPRDLYFHNGENALFRATVMNHGKMVDCMLENHPGHDINDSTNGQNALCAAVFFEHTRIVDSLLQHGADINGCTRDGFTALLLAVHVQNLDILGKLLSAKGPDLTHQNKDGYNALLLAAKFNNVLICEDLIHHLWKTQQLDILNATTPQGYSALMLCVSHGNYPLVRTLMKCKANINIEAEGETAISLAYKHRHRSPEIWNFICTRHAPRSQKGEVEPLSETQRVEGDREDEQKDFDWLSSLFQRLHIDRKFVDNFVKEGIRTEAELHEISREDCKKLVPSYVQRWKLKKYLEKTTAAHSNVE